MKFIGQRHIFGTAALIVVILAILLSTKLWRKPELPPLMVGTNLWPGYEPLYLARELDLFHESDVRLVDYSSATQVIQAFRNRAIQAAALTLDEVILLRQNGIDGAIILVTDISDGADVVLGKPGITSLEHLRQKRVGVENTALGAFVLSRALASAGMSPGDVELVSLEVDEHEVAFHNDQVDAVVTFEPVRSKLLNKGAVLLFDSSRIPGEVVDVVVVRRDDLEDREPQLLAMLSGWYRARAFLAEEPDKAHAIMAKRLGIEPTAAPGVFEGLHLPSHGETLKMLQGSPSPLTHTARDLAASMHEANLISTRIALDDLTEPGPLSKVPSHEDR